MIWIPRPRHGLMAQILRIAGTVLAVILTPTLAGLPAYGIAYLVRGVTRAILGFP